MVRAASYIAGTFNQDPLEMLDCDPIEWQIRLQAANYHNDEMRKQQAKNQAKVR